jgi:hypothetical protein
MLLKQKSRALATTVGTLRCVVAFWWVNHKQTYRQETEGGYVPASAAGRTVLSRMV